jgi:hypothetical protein
MAPAAVPERLDAKLSDADGVRVVSMWREGRPTEIGAHELDAWCGLKCSNATDLALHAAQTFKTPYSRSGTIGFPRIKEHRPTMTIDQIAAFVLFAIAAAGTLGPRA